MTEAIVVAIITGGLSLCGVFVSSYSTRVKVQSELDKQLALLKQMVEISQANTEKNVTELTKEVREHNNFARRLPVVEEQIKVINHRIDDLEKKVC